MTAEERKEVAEKTYRAIQHKKNKYVKGDESLSYIIERHYKIDKKMRNHRKK